MRPPIIYIMVSDPGEAPYNTGAEFSSQDVAANLKRMRQPAGGLAMNPGSILENSKGAEYIITEEPHTLKKLNRKSKQHKEILEKYYG